MSLGAHQTIAKRYAKAFYLLSSKSGTLEKESQTLEKLAYVCVNKKSNAFLLSPVVNKAKKKEFLWQVMEKINASDSLKNFMSVLLEAGRLALLADIEKSLKEMIQKASGTEVVDITTARECTSEEYEKIEASINRVLKRPLVFKRNIDQKILGGFKAEFSNNVIDATLKTKLDSLTKVLEA